MEQVDGRAPHGMVAMDVGGELAAGAVETVEGHIVGDDGGPTGTQEVRVPVRRHRKTRGGVKKGAFGGTWCIQGGSGRSTGPAWSAELASRPLEHKALGPNCAGSGLMDTACGRADRTSLAGCGDACRGV